MGEGHLGHRLAVQASLTASQRRGARLFGVARPGPSTHTGISTMNDNHNNQPDLIEEQIVRLEIQKIRLETQLIEAGMRRDRVRLVLDIVKWTVITAAVAFAFIAADRLGWL